MGSSNVKSLFGGPVEEKHCDAHGPYKSTKMVLSGREIWSDCPICSKEKIAEEDKKIRQEAFRAQEQAKAQHLFGRAAIPKRFVSRTLENYVAKSEGQIKALSASTRYADSWKENLENGTSLIFTGKPGTGKTHLAVGIARKVMELSGTAMYTRVIEIAQAVKETYSGNGKSERQVIRDFAQPDLLIIDEVGRQFGSDAEKMYLFEVINARYEECKPTIVISNLGVERLKEYVDDAAIDRLREGGGRMVVFDWESSRGGI
jgi:DNA replication protein DnaC